MSGIKLEETVHGEAIALSVRGSAGPSEGEALERAFTDIAGKKHKTVVLDLAGLDYLSSFGIGCLIKLHRDVAEGGGTLRLAALNHDIEDVLVKSRLDSKFEIFGTVDEALPR